MNAASDLIGPRALEPNGRRATMPLPLVAGYVLVFIGGLHCTPSVAQDEEHPKILASSREFQETADAALKGLADRHFDKELISPSLGSMAPSDYDALVRRIKREEALPESLFNQPRDVVYDVILQPGHYGRTQGRVGTHGQLVSERALVAYIAGMVSDALRQRGVKVMLVKADDPLSSATSSQANEKKLRATVFLAIHTDGSENPCTSGPSLGYEVGSSVIAMHTIGAALAIAMGYDYDEFKRENFTVGEAHYYMFPRVRAPVKGILEIGELTCPKSERVLIESTQGIAADIATALRFIETSEDLRRRAN